MGMMHSMYTQTFPPKPKYSINEIPDLSGKVVLITGGNSGVGYETAKAILPRNAKVYLACRSPQKGKEAIERLKKETGKEALYLELDLASLKSIKKAAAEFVKLEPELHILFNNAGVMTPPASELTTDGYDLQVGVNVLGHFYLTTLLLPSLFRVAEEHPGTKARVVTTASSAAELTSRLDPETFKPGKARTKAGMDDMYAQSKLGNVVVATELAKRYGDKIVSVTVNPGNLETGLQRTLTKFRRWVVSFILHPASYGALTQLYVGTSPEGEGFNGKYFIPWARPYHPPAVSQKPEVGKKLWTWLEAQVKNV